MQLKDCILYTLDPLAYLLVIKDEGILQSIDLQAIYFISVSLLTHFWVRVTQLRIAWPILKTLLACFLFANGWGSGHTTFY